MLDNLESLFVFSVVLKAHLVYLLACFWLKCEVTLEQSSLDALIVWSALSL